MSKRVKLATRRVSFAADCKAFDGLSDRSVLLEHVVHRLFYRRLAVNELYVLQLVDSDLERAWGLLQDLADLVWRMGLPGDEQPPKRSFLLLERGGGANLRLVREHFPFVLLLGKVVEAAFRRLSAAAPPSTEVPFPQPSAAPAVVT